MTFSGGCYCGNLRYQANGAPRIKAQCHCRECQYISGGGPNYFILMPGDGFSYAQGTPKSFTRSDLENPVTREFCADCGTHILTRRNDITDVVLKVGTLDTPEVFESAMMAIFTVDQQPFHTLPEGIPVFERMPQR